MKRLLILFIYVLLCSIATLAQVSLDLRVKDGVYAKPIKHKQGKINTIYRLHDSNNNVMHVNISESVMLLSEKFKCIANFRNCSFLDTAYFSFSTFSNEAYFDNSMFSKAVNFWMSTFLETADFSGSTFLDTADFSCSTFSKSTIFSGSRFSKLTFFYSSTFSKTVDWSGTVFLDTIYFHRSRFSENLDFSCSAFSKIAFFSYDTFSKTADFSHDTFSNTADFSGSTFSNTTDFSSLSLTDTSKLDFSDATLPSLFDFSFNSKLNNEVVLTDANFDSTTRYTEEERVWHFINLYKTDIPKVRTDYQHFRLCFYTDGKDTAFQHVWFFSDTIVFGKEKYHLNDTLLINKLWENASFRQYIYTLFPSCRYISLDGFGATLHDKFISEVWRETICDEVPPLRDNVIRHFIEYYKESRFPKRLPDDDIMAIYEQVRKTYADGGQQLSYQKIDIEYQDFKHGANFLPHIWNCYGYHKEWVFYWAAIFLSLFTVITFCCVGYLNVNVYTLPYFKDVDVLWRSPFTRFWYSIVYTAVVFFLFSLKMENFHFGKTPRKIFGSLYVVLIYTAGIACLAYMANFVLQK